MPNNFKSLFRFDTGTGNGGSAPAAGTGDNGNGLTGDFNADFQRYFGKGAGNVKPSAAVTGDKKAEKGEKTEAAAGSVTAEGTDGQNTSAVKTDKPDPQKEYDDFIASHREQHTRHVQGIINERFKKSKASEKEYSELKESIIPLFARYGLEENDVEGLRKAIHDDTSLYVDQAIENNKSAEAYRDELYSKRKATLDAAAQKEADKRAAQEQTFRRWQAESEEIRKIYPSFDLRTELMENVAFRDAVYNGAPLMLAYRGSRFDELSAQLAAAATQNASRRTAETIAANSRRPAEAGTGSGGISGVKRDVNSLSDSDILKILDSVSKGAKISF